MRGEKAEVGILGADPFGDAEVGPYTSVLSA